MKAKLYSIFIESNKYFVAILYYFPIFSVFFKKIEKINYSLLYKVECKLFVFLRKNYAFLWPFVFRFNKGYLEINNTFFFLNLKCCRHIFARVEIATYMWLFIISIINTILSKTDRYSVMYIKYQFLFIYLIFKKRFYFIFKSKAGCLGLWPAISVMPDKLYNIAESYNYNFDSVLNESLFNDIDNIIKSKTCKKIYKSPQLYSFKSYIKYIFSGKYFINNNVINLFKNSFKNENFFFFLRKQRSFNKGRYSRNRQTYRTGVYWCLYLNIVALVGLNYLFYKFSLNIMYYWWLIFIFIFICFISSFAKFYKYIYYDIIYIYKFVDLTLIEKTKYLYNYIYNDYINFLEDFYISVTTQYKDIFFFFKSL